MTMIMKHYDVLIIGAGQAGIPLARKLAESGRRVALAERKHLGGSCVNFGCTPTKAVLASARVVHLAQRAADFGIRLPPAEIDFFKVLQRARKIVEESKTGLHKGLSDCGADVLRGQARLTGRAESGFSFAVDGTIGTAEQVVINTGARTRLPPIEGLADVPYLHAGNWLDGDALPEHVVFAGAGSIALEMAQFYRRLGSRVTVVGAGRHVASREDPDVADALQRVLEGEGVSFRLNTRVQAVAATATGVSVTVKSDENYRQIAASHLFVAAGRKPNTDDAGLETVGVEIDDHGFLKVAENLATTVSGIWAAGDVRGGPMFTHTSWDDHRVLESQLLGDGTRTTAGRVVPYAIFTDPQLGRVGLTEDEARNLHGQHTRCATFEMKHNGKAAEIGEPAGFIKLIADARDGRLLGAAVLAAEGAELVAAYITLMNAGATLPAICGGIYIHPTLSEAVQSAALALDLQIRSTLMTSQ